MGRAIQRLEDLHHGFAMDRFGACKSNCVTAHE